MLSKLYLTCIHYLNPANHFTAKYKDMLIHTKDTHNCDYSTRWIYIPLYELSIDYMFMQIVVQQTWYMYNYVLWVTGIVNTFTIVVPNDTFKCFNGQCSGNTSMLISHQARVILQEKYVYHVLGFCRSICICLIFPSMCYTSKGTFQHEKFISICQSVPVDIIFWKPWYGHSYVLVTKIGVRDKSMAHCKTALSPLLTHWRYCSLALSHRHDISLYLSFRGSVDGLLLLMVVYTLWQHRYTGALTSFHGWCNMTDVIVIIRLNTGPGECWGGDQIGKQ